MSINTTECGFYLEAQKEQIFAQWEELANEKLKAASNAPDLIVRNYLPYFLANLVSELKAFEMDSGSDLEKINNIDLLPEFQNKVGKESDVWVSREDSHPNILGHRIGSDRKYLPEHDINGTLSFYFAFLA